MYITVLVALCTMDCGLWQAQVLEPPQYGPPAAWHGPLKTAQGIRVDRMSILHVQCLKLLGHGPSCSDASLAEIQPLVWCYCTVTTRAAQHIPSTVGGETALKHCLQETQSLHNQWGESETGENSVIPEDVKGTQGLIGKQVGL